MVTLLDSETRKSVASTITAQDGEYVFYDVAEGSYILVASKIGYKTSSDVLLTAKNNTVLNLDLKLSLNPLENLGTVSGVISHGGIAVANAFVGLYKVSEDNENETLITTTRTNRDGLYMFGKVEKGQYKVKAKMNK